jgi:hypothetical protein
MFRFSVKEKAHQPLAPAHLKSSQVKFKDVVYLIVDEKAMVSVKLLTWFHRRLDEIFPLRRKDPFTGISVIIAGDFFQLSLVAEKALYKTSKSTATDTILGQQLHRFFDRTITLDDIEH